MLDIVNHTPLSVELHTALDKDCQDYAVVVIKALCTIVDGAPLQLAKDKAVIYAANKHFGDPQTTAVQYATDVVQTKLATDVVVNGHAYAPQGAYSSLDVGLQINEHRIIRRVFGDRFWVPSLYSWQITQPKAFRIIPLTFENAFGGSHWDSQQQLVDSFSANPLGKGYISVHEDEPREGQALPNIEFPQYLIDKWTDKPPPAAPGFIANQWQPRVAYQGTYDEAWKKTWAPLLPQDFDPRFFNAAPADLQIPYLQGGEHVRLARLTASGQLSFQIPTWELNLSVVSRGRAVDIVPVLDTLVIEPDKLEAQLTWRASFKCFNQLLYLDKVIVTARSR